MSLGVLFEKLPASQLGGGYHAAAAANTQAADVHLLVLYICDSTYYLSG